MTLPQPTILKPSGLLAVWYVVMIAFAVAALAAVPLAVIWIDGASGQLAVATFSLAGIAFGIDAANSLSNRMAFSAEGLATYHAVGRRQWGRRFIAWDRTESVRAVGRVGSLTAVVVSGSGSEVKADLMWAPAHVVVRETAARTRPETWGDSFRRLVPGAV